MQALAPVDYHLVFTQRALADLAEIIGHIAGDDNDVASRFGGALLIMWIYCARTHEWLAQSANRESYGGWYIARFWFTTKSTKKSASWRYVTSGMARGSHQNLRRFQLA